MSGSPPQLPMCEHLLVSLSCYIWVRTQRIVEFNEMEQIKHRIVEVNGIKMHVAEKGEGPVVLFLHGFPELWYSWRHQILSLTSLL